MRRIEQRWIAVAPLAVVLCTIVVSDEREGRSIQCQRFPQMARAVEAMDRALYASLNMEEHQTKIAGTHMALVALEHGIGSCWVSRFDVQRVADLLRLPDDHIPSEILVFGYPAQTNGPRLKKPLADVVFNNVYG